MTTRKAVEPQHDLVAFLRAIESQIAAEYVRIRARAKSDPGTAGDQSEENWATLLRNWLPATYPVVTKGRLINEYGDVTPQLDVVVLRPDYPLHLRDKKMFLSGGVVAVFECKLTLKKTHLAKAVETCKIVKNLTDNYKKTPFRELQRPILYGILAHSHAFAKGEHGAAFAILDAVEGASFALAKQPHELIDVITVADAVSLTLSKWLALAPHRDRDEKEYFPDGDKEGGVATCYFARHNYEDLPFSRGVVLGSLIGHVTYVLACENQSLRPYANYLLANAAFAGGIGRPVGWTPDALSHETRARIVKNGYSPEEWSEWRKDLL
jgi:uncharacterized protein DUF6602